MSFNQKGYSLVELIVAITIVTFLGLAMFNLYFSITKTITYYRERATVSGLANNYLEIARNMDYDKIGTINGNPAGNLPDLQNPLTITADKYSYQIYYVVNTISNDPVNSPGAQDYKQVKLYIKELKNNTINTFTTTVAPTNIYAGNVGSLAIKVYDAVGSPLSGFNIHIVNTNITPNINLCRLTDSTGSWNEAGLPCSAPRGNACTTSGLSGYQVTANDINCPGYNASYSVDKTYSTAQTAPSTPTPPDATIYYNQATYLDFQIDLLSNLTFNILDGETESCDPKQGVGLEVRGEKKIGVVPNLYKYDKSSGSGLSYSNAQGKISLSNIEWDTYTPAVLGATYMIYGTSPVQPFFILPNTTSEVNLVVGPYSTNSLLVTVKDAITKNPINGATVNLSGTEKTTGQVLTCTDVNQTPGQAMFAGLTAGSFSLTANAAGYDEEIINPISISGIMALTVELAPTGGIIPPVQHIIKASINTSGGTISPSGNVVVNDGDNKTFTISAKPGFFIKEVLVDSISQGAISTYTFTNVITDHTISATFTSESNTCSPPGITQPCPGGVQTCQSDGTWGTCESTAQFACAISDSGGSRNWNDPLSWTNCNDTYPQTGDNVSATATSGNLIVNVTTNSLTSLDLTNYAGVLSGNYNIIVAPATGTVQVLFPSDMTQSWTGYLYLRPATGATINLTTNGTSVRGVIVDSGKGTIQQQDDITVTSYGFNLNSNGATWNTNNRNITVATGSYFYAYNNAIFNAGTGTVLISSANATTIYSSGANKFYNLSITGGTSATAYVQLYADTAVTNNFSITGTNNTTKRLFFRSNTIGTQRKMTLTGTTGNSYSNVDFRDIDLYSASGKIDLSNIAGLSGDCGGNNSTNMTLTAPMNLHWTTNPAAGNLWSEYKSWSATTNGPYDTGRVPLCQDNIYMDYGFAANKTVTVDMTRPGATIDWSGTTWNGSFTWTWGSLYPEIYGSLILKNGMTLGSGNYFTMAGRGANTLTTDGVTLTGGIMFNMGAGAGIGTGSVAIQDDLTIPYTGKYFYMYSGTVTNPNNSAIKMSYFYKTGGSLTMCNGSCTWYLSNTSSSAVPIWRTNGTSAQLNTAGSTIDISNNASPSGTINDVLTLYGLTYNNLIIHGDSGTKGITLYNSSYPSYPNNNTFTGTFTITGKKTVIFQQGSTQTVGNFSANGSSENLVTIKSSMSGQGLPGACESNLYFTFAKTGGGVISPSNYLSLQDSYATPTNTWYAGNNSVDILCGDGTKTSNDGWIFSSSP